MTTMKRVSAIAGASLMLVMLASQAQEPRSRQAEQQESANQMPMQMMHECMGHCQAMSGSMQKLRATVEQARKSNDPAQMRAALDKVQTHMSSTEEHMNGCMQMMDRNDHGAADHGGGADRSNADERENQQ